VHRLAEGRLPAGLQLTAAGYLTGLPAHTGHSRFAIEIDNGCGPKAVVFQLTVRPAPRLWLEARRIESAPDRTVQEPRSEETLPQDTAVQGHSSEQAQVLRAGTKPAGAAPAPPGETPIELRLGPDTGYGGDGSARVRVSSDWAGLPYTAESSAPWLAASPLRGRTPVPGEALAADPVEIRADPSALAPGEHTAEIRFSSRHAVNAPAVRVRVLVIR
jgi:hypothetical protein